MPSYKVNRHAVAHVRDLIKGRHYVLDSDWGEAQPSADDENRFLKRHSWKEYGDWHLGLTDDATDLDAFRGLDGLELAVRVAVVSDEGPNDLGEAADILVGDPHALAGLLRRLV